jgi:hypothetical protein
MILDQDQDHRSFCFILSVLKTIQTISKINWLGDCSKRPFEDHIIFRSFLEQQDLFASLLSVLWLKTRKNNKKIQ